jgi:aminodeoxyfutalosine deaminase
VNIPIDRTGSSRDPAVETVSVHAATTVVPIVGQPIADGAVAIRGERILAVGPRDEILRAHPRAQTHTWEGVLTPGLVNAHTHLQYTSFAQVGAGPYSNYFAWSDAFIDEYGRGRTHDQWAASTRDGITRSLAAGVTCFADVVTDAGARDALIDHGVAGVAYFELLGLDAESWAADAERELLAVIEAAATTEWVRVGLSPHTPYTVDQPVLRASADLARRLGLRLHVHLGEVDSEAEFYRSGTGPLAERMARLSSPAWYVLSRGGTGMGIADYAHSCGLLGPDSHVAHGVYLDSKDRRVLREQGTAVALCPRSNEVVGVGAPPVAAMLEERVDVAVGTDSLASSPSLDPLEDVALLRSLAIEQGYRRDDLDARLLHAATLGGAAAIGMADAVGSLEIAKRADLAVFDVDPAVDTVYTALAEQAASRCIATVTGGRSRWRADEA